MRDVNLTHTIRGDEDFLDRTLASAGIPLLHILRATNGSEFRFYELTGDLEEALHFTDFSEAIPTPEPTYRIQIGESIDHQEPDEHQVDKRIHLID
jgi:hypothetical protein